MAYDAVRARALLFGGTAAYTAGQFSDAWSWDGTAWTQLQGAGPPARAGHAMAYDSSRDRIVLFGGSAYLAGSFADTWEWDGTAWMQVAAPGPAARSDHTMVYDAARGHVVLFGGYLQDGTPTRDTWTWDGTNWTLAATTGPELRAAHVAAYDPIQQRVLLFGGDGSEGSVYRTYGDVWSWDGAAWTWVTGSGPAARYDAAMAFDEARGQLVLTGGTQRIASEPAPLGDTWVMNGSSWTKVADAAGVAARSRHAGAYDTDRQRMVVFGGSTATGGLVRGTQEWDGQGWISHVSFDPPDPVVDHAMAYDAARGVTVMHGGQSAPNTTWTWDGAAWTLATHAGPPRYRHAMAYDAQRQRVVLFGGLVSAGVRSNETWEWDGATWTRVATTGPQARNGHSMAYDSVNHRILMFGGQVNSDSSTGLFNDLWAWDGVNWTLLSTSGPYHADAAMSFDESAGLLVVTGGYIGGSLVDGKTHTWDGSEWRLMTYEAFPEGRANAVMTCDPQRRRLLLFGGASSSETYSDLWIHRFATVDLTGDGIVDFADYLEFLNLYDVLDPRADLNLDGLVDFADYLEFLNLYDAGC